MSSCSVQIDSVDPTHPNCYEKCIHRFTWTDENKKKF